jgi:tetratricopeptide (TPR) repeat protein
LTYENFPGVGYAGKVRELVAYFKRIEGVSELVEACRNRRPTVQWPDMPKASATASYAPSSQLEQSQSKSKQVDDLARRRTRYDELIRKGEILVELTDDLELRLNLAEFRRARAADFAREHYYEEAIADLKRASELNPDNKDYFEECS